MRYVCRKIGVAAEPCGFEEGLSNRIKFGRAARCGTRAGSLCFIMPVVATAAGASTPSQVDPRFNAQSQVAHRAQSLPLIQDLQPELLAKDALHHLRRSIQLLSHNAVPVHIAPFKQQACVGGGFIWQMGTILNPGGNFSESGRANKKIGMSDYFEAIR